MSAPIWIDAVCSERGPCLAFLYPPGCEPERLAVIVEFMGRSALLSDPELEVVLDRLCMDGRMSVNERRTVRRQREAGRFAYPRWPR